MPYLVPTLPKPRDVLLQIEADFDLLDCEFDRKYVVWLPSLLKLYGTQSRKGTSPSVVLYSLQVRSPFSVHDLAGTISKL